MTRDRRFERRLLGLNAVLLALLLALGLSSFWAVVPKPWRDLEPEAQPRPVTARGELAELEATTIEVFRSAAPAVVHITTMVTAAGPFSLTSSRSRREPAPASCGTRTGTSSPTITSSAMPAER